MGYLALPCLSASTARRIETLRSCTPMCGISYSFPLYFMKGDSGLPKVRNRRWEPGASSRAGAEGGNTELQFPFRRPKTKRRKSIDFEPSCERGQCTATELPLNRQ